MAKRREDHPLSKHTINLYQGDFPKLQTLYTSRIGAAKVIRDIVRAHIRLVEENAAQKTSLIGELDLDDLDEEIVATGD